MILSFFWLDNLILLDPLLRNRIKIVFIFLSSALPERFISTKILNRCFPCNILVMQIIRQFAKKPTCFR